MTTLSQGGDMRITIPVFILLLVATCSLAQRDAAPSFAHEEIRFANNEFELVNPWITPEVLCPNSKSTT